MSLRNCRKVKVLDVVPVGQSKRPGEFFELTLEYPDWDKCQPGQFVMIRPASWELDLMWGRPFSVYSAKEGVLTLFIQKVGRGTERISKLASGDEVFIWGPLGNTFAVESDVTTTLFAGGIGIAPFYQYIDAHPNPENLHLFFAHRMELECYPYDEMAAKVGKATALWEQKPEDLQTIINGMGEAMRDTGDGLALCCGPTPFMKTAQNFANEHGVRCQVSLENRMACGVGACLGCVSKDHEDHNVQVCTRGPIFWSDKITL